MEGPQTRKLHTHLESTQNQGQRGRGVPFLLPCLSPAPPGLGCLQTTANPLLRWSCTQNPSIPGAGLRLVPIFS